MTTTSTLMTAIVLGLTLLGVVSFASVYQQVRYSYLNRMAAMIARTEEAVSVGGWKSGTYMVLDLKNDGGVGVFVRELRVAVQVILYIRVGENLITTSRSVTLVNRSIYLPPLGRVFLSYDLSKEVPSYASRAEVSFASVLVVTERNVFVFDVVPPTDVAVLLISKEDIESGATFSVPLPDGRVAVLRPYEILFCGVASGSRNDEVVPRFDSVAVLVTGGGTTIRGAYHYGYDFTNNKWSIVSILFDRVVEPDERRLLTACMLSTTRDNMFPSGTRVVLGRGILLIGTQLSGYDVSVALFAMNQYPTFYTPERAGRGPRTTIENTMVNLLTLKLGLPSPSTEVDVYDFLGPQLVPLVIGVRDGTSVYSIGTAYSQAILILQTIYGTTTKVSDTIEVYGYFPDPYPTMIVIASPTGTATV